MGETRETGTVETADGTLSIGVDGRKVGLYVGGWLSADGVRLNTAQIDEFVRKFFEACWEAAGQQGAGDG